MTRTLQRLVMPLLVLLAAACSSPSERFDELARSRGLAKTVVGGTRFEHVLYHSMPHPRPLDDGALLHVYVDGDGTPWKTRTAVAADPTPRRPMALSMMVRDRQPSLYLGRPCYHGLAASGHCAPLWWTHRRYSEAVVESMARALQSQTARYGHPPIVLIGYSGGAVLARLIAERIPATRALITVAGNLDLDSWTELHGYSPLVGSLDPARQPPLDAGIPQLHLQGGRDRNCPPRIAASYLDKEADALLRIYNDYDHGCCWVENWPEILESALEMLGLGASMPRARPSPSPSRRRRADLR